jgi:hypothetical protein
MSIREYTPAERAAFARHEDEQRRREACEMTFTQRIDWLHDANQLAWKMLLKHPLRHRLDPATLKPLPRGKSDAPGSPSPDGG